MSKALYKSGDDVASGSLVAMNLISDSDLTPQSSILGSAMRLLPKTAQVLDRGSEVTNSNYKYGFRQ